MSTTTSPGRSGTPARVAAASLIGTTIEYYDFFIYGTAAALVFPKLFFPEATPLLGSLLAFATFGVGFLARPLGGIVFGHFGDRVGRKKMLVISLVGMGASTFLMGLLPGYAQIGLAAPILLTVLRLVQGFMVGGEWGGATLMAVEHAPRGKKGFYGAFPQMGAPAGTSLATVAFLLMALLPNDQFLAWGWRIPFLISALLVAVGLVIRLTIAESPAFAAARQKQDLVRVPIAAAFRKHPKEIFLVAGTYLSQGVFAYITMSYLVSYATASVKIDRVAVLLSVFAAGLVAVVLYPVFGALSDKWGRKTMYFLGATAMGAVIWPAFMLINTGSVLNFLVAVVLVFGVAMAPAAGVTGSLFALVFSPEVRYSGASVGYTISQIAGSAFAPMIATALLASTGTSDSIVVYMVIVSVISMVSVALLPGGWGRREVGQQAQAEEASRAAAI
ncbi:MFS transporter [Sinomonas atrocyanea]|uniref:MFS transporter n=1 Tax=Sinomonas atrocyanea TaxID=37927 RepID=UPI00277D174D|nr:MFS transporter [Sinomonas atrocyanea]MDQ0259484.1 metabolite-proton symporter [Sinomonas atrocyanea]MDR6623374.1 metabolite-proton symporter [Sinomonas atrocyanea]